MKEIEAWQRAAIYRGAQDVLLENGTAEVYGLCYALKQVLVQTFRATTAESIQIMFETVFLDEVQEYLGEKFERYEYSAKLPHPYSPEGKDARLTVLGVLAAKWELQAFKDEKPRAQIVDLMEALKS